MCYLATDASWLGVSECISGGTRALYLALIKMDRKSCLSCVFLMGPLSTLCCEFMGRYQIHYRTTVFRSFPEAQSFFLPTVDISKIHPFSLLISLCFPSSVLPLSSLFFSFSSPLFLSPLPFFRHHFRQCHCKNVNLS